MNDLIKRLIESPEYKPTVHLYTLNARKVNIGSPMCPLCGWSGLQNEQWAEQELARCPACGATLLVEFSRRENCLYEVTAVSVRVI